MNDHWWNGFLVGGMIGMVVMTVAAGVVAWLNPC